MKRNKDRSEPNNIYRGHSINRYNTTDLKCRSTVGNRAESTVVVCSDCGARLSLALSWWQPREDVLNLPYV